MNFIKNHYEKVLLGAVLAGLVVAAITLPFKVAKEKSDLEEIRRQITEQRPSPLSPLNLERTMTALKRLQEPAALNFGKPHYLFNPGPWQKAPDGSLVPVLEREFTIQVTKVTPLYLIITLESVGASGTNYLIKVERETELRSDLRKRSEFVALNVKASRLPVILRSVEGPPEKPTKLVLELIDTGERISVGFDKPYQRVDGYTADLRCDAENKTWRGQRVGAKLAFSGDEFTIIAINPVATNKFEVVLSARSTGKKFTVRYEKKDDDIQKPATKLGARS